MNWIWATVCFVGYVAVTACTVFQAPEKAEPIKVPQGFSVFSDQLNGLPKDSKVLFFFHLHHCPNCDLVINHLIETGQFQNLTKGVKRFVVNSGQAKNEQIVKKFNLRGSPVFVLADSNYNLLSKSPYGLLSWSQFFDWFSKGQIQLSKKEKTAFKEAATILRKAKVPIDEATSLKSLTYKLSSNVEKVPEKDRARAVKLILNYLEGQKATQQKHDLSGYYYGRGHTFQALSILGEKIRQPRFSKKMAEEALENFNKMQSGPHKLDLGKSIFLINQMIKLNKDDEVSSLVHQLANRKEDRNLTAVYLNTAYGYWSHRKDCDKVLYFTNRISMNFIPVDIDKIYLADLRVKCLVSLKKNKEAADEFKTLLASLSTEAKTVYSSKIEKIKGYLSK